MWCTRFGEVLQQLLTLATVFGRLEIRYIDRYIANRLMCTLWKLHICVYTFPHSQFHLPCLCLFLSVTHTHTRCFFRFLRIYLSLSFSIYRSRITQLSLLLFSVHSNSCQPNSYAYKKKSLYLYIVPTTSDCYSKHFFKKEKHIMVIVWIVPKTHKFL